ncbi:hypothetical protein [Trichlorobacter lovleyi]|uniref:hypothetical protein n=1 Tax=Trichlorobacter lovleyi TaxID=313985 RepID=UPI00247FB839|nr:hypothetical protein [Trichlorobacter lovleyi]
MEIVDIKQKVNKVFSPVMQKLGLHNFCESDRTTTLFSLAYFSEEVGLELSVDLSDFYIYVLLFKPDGKNIPIGYTDSAGHRQKIYLQEALKILSIDIESINKKLQKLGGNYQNCSEMLAILKVVVEENWELLVSERNRWFC